MFLVHVALGVLSGLTEARDKFSMKFLGKDHGFVCWSAIIILSICVSPQFWCLGVLPPSTLAAAGPLPLFALPVSASDLQ